MKKIRKAKVPATIAFDKKDTDIKRLVLTITELIPVKRNKKADEELGEPADPDEIEEVDIEDVDLGDFGITDPDDYVEPDEDSEENEPDGDDGLEDLGFGEEPEEPKEPKKTRGKIRFKKQVRIVELAEADVSFKNPVLTNVTNEEDINDIEWNKGCLPASLTFERGESARFAFVEKGSLKKWVVTDSDYQGRGDFECMEDSTIQVKLKHWALIHGLASDSEPSGFDLNDIANNAKDKTSGDDLSKVEVCASASMDYVSALMQLKFIDEESNPLSGFELYIDDEKYACGQFGDYVRFCLPFNGSFIYYMVLGEYTARGTLTVKEEADITKTFRAKKNAVVPLETAVSKFNINSSVRLASSCDNILTLKIANEDWNAPRSGWNLRLWKHLAGTDGTTPEFIRNENVARIIKPNSLQQPIEVWLPAVAGDTISGEDADTWLWELKNGSWYASGKAEMNQPLTLNVLVSSVLGQMTDPRDGKTYKTAIMPDGKLWTAQNLDYAMLDIGDYYGESESEKADSAVLFGRLYSADEALNGRSYLNFNPSGRQGVAPPGWHIPSDDEWSQLMKAATKEDGYNSDKTALGDSDTGMHGRYLKSADFNFKGIDSFGFNALPGGRQNGDEFEGKNAMTEFISCSDFNGETAIPRLLIGTRDNAERDRFASKADRRGYARIIKNRVN